jgi:hypothetical protein
MSDSTSAPQAILDVVERENRIQARELRDRNREAKFLSDADAAFIRGIIERPDADPFASFWRLQQISRRERVDERSTDLTATVSRASHFS